MRYLNTVYVRNHRAQIRHRRGSLVVSSPAGSQRVPLEAVDGLVLLGGTQITTQALDACARRGVRVAALQMSGALRFVVNGPTSGNVHLRTAQFETVMDEMRSLAVAKSIVAAKLQNSRRVLGRWARDEKGAEMAEQLASRSTQIAARIARLPEAQSANSVRGIEGDAARIYFRAMRLALASSELEFSGRTRRPPRDPVNALLGFCYGMLVTECIGAAESVGLDHQMGCFHRPRAGRPSLALDLAEEFRAISDRFVVSLVRRRQIGPEDFDRSPGGAVYLSDHGRTRLLPAWEKHKESEVQHQLLRRPVERWALPSVQATLLARHFRGDLPAYPPFVLP
ncbi:MAG: CRISPR-associated endonuclease Cas1 [Chloroflexi bacterium]|nr:CRISPR-associated endonuclease Cas1 [Chloroflexota bacterium]